MWKSFFGVSHITPRICLIYTRKKKSLFCCFLTPKIPLESPNMTAKHSKSANMTPRVKFLRENLRDVLFLDVFNQANFKYAQEKDAICYILSVKIVQELALLYFPKYFLAFRTYFQVVTTSCSLRMPDFFLQLHPHLPTHTHITHTRTHMPTPTQHNFAIT